MIKQTRNISGQPRTIRRFAALLPVCGLTLAAGLLHAAVEPSPAPVWSLPDGVYTNSQKLQITARGAIVRYTTDGSEPTETSTVYSTPLNVTNSMLVRAKSFAPSRPPSPTVSRDLVLLGEDLLDFSSNLPLVIINTHGEEFSAERNTRMAATARFINTNGARARLTGPADFDGRALMNVRGHASRRYPKHSFTFRAIDENDEKLKISVFGFPKETEWVLYAPYPDKTLMRDVLAYELSNLMGRWAPRTRFVEVFVNQTGGRLTMEDYAGVYVFEDKITRGADRVDIARLRPDENSEPAITGGYLFKKDHVGRGPAKRAIPERVRGLHNIEPGGPIDLPSGPGGFPADPAGFLSHNSPAALALARRTARARSKMEAPDGPLAGVTSQLGLNWQPSLKREREINDGKVFPDEDGFWTTIKGSHFFYVEPEPDEITASQRAWLKDHLDIFERTLYGPDFMNATNGYSSFIDAGSFIDHHLMVEATKNVDGFRFSTFYQKDRGGRIKMEPVWDMNLTFGNAGTREGWKPEHWLWPQWDDTEYTWFRRLFEDPDFAQRYVDRWAALRTNVFSTARVLARIDQLAGHLQEAQQRNFTRWPVLGVAVAPNHFVGSNYTSEINFLKTWTEGRLAWMDRQFLAAPAIQTTPDGEKLLLADSITPPKKLPPPAPRQDFTLFMEAESGGIVAPLAIEKDPDASGGQFIVNTAKSKTTDGSNGTATFKFSVPATNQYFLWARVLVASTANNTFFFSMDGAPEEIYDAAENSFTSVWQWNHWSGRPPAASPQNSTRKVFPLGAGVHTLQLRGREEDMKLDRLCITSNPDFEPEPSPAETAVPTRIYYTLDGTDPRLPGGVVSPSARLLDSPVTLGRNAKVIARAQKGQRWSSPAMAGATGR